MRKMMKDFYFILERRNYSISSRRVVSCAKSSFGRPTTTKEKEEPQQEKKTRNKRSSRSSYLLERDELFPSSCLMSRLFQLFIYLFTWLFGSGVGPEKRKIKKGQRGVRKILCTGSILKEDRLAGSRKQENGMVRNLDSGFIHPWIYISRADIIHRQKAKAKSRKYKKDIDWQLHRVVVVRDAFSWSWLPFYYIKYLLDQENGIRFDLIA